MGRTPNHAKFMKVARKARLKRGLRQVLVFLLVLVLLFLGGVAYANITAIWASCGRLFTDVSALPATTVGVGVRHDGPGKRPEKT